MNAPAEVWCRHCAEPSVEVVNGEAYCATHAWLQRYRLTAPSWNPKPRRRPMR